MIRKAPFWSKRIYAVRASEGSYFIFDSYTTMAASVADLKNSYQICIDEMESREEAQRWLESYNVYNQIRYQRDNTSPQADIKTLPLSNTVPYGAKGASLPLKNYTGSYYTIICSTGCYFCMPNINEVSNLLLGLSPMPHIRIQRYNTVDEASRQVLARNAAIQALNGEKVTLLPPIQESRPYGVQGTSINYSNIQLNQGGDF